MAVGDWEDRRDPAAINRNEDDTPEHLRASSILKQPGEKRLYDKTSDEVPSGRYASQTDTRWGEPKMDSAFVKSVNTGLDKSSQTAGNTDPKEMRRAYNPSGNMHSVPLDRTWVEPDHVRAKGSGAVSEVGYDPTQKTFQEKLAIVQGLRNQPSNTSTGGTGGTSTGKQSFSAAQKIGLNRLSDTDMRNLRVGMNGAGSPGEIEGTMMEAKLRASGKYDQRMKNMMQGYGQREGGKGTWANKRDIGAIGRDELTRQLVSDTLGVSDAQGRPPSRGIRRYAEAAPVVMPPPVDASAQIANQKNTASLDYTEATNTDDELGREYE